MRMSRRSSILSEGSFANGSTSLENASPVCEAVDVAKPAVHKEASHDNDDETPVTQPVQVLKGVVAYVEVRTNNDNRSHAISQALKQMGATVVDKFTDDVTHVIYKEGKKRTRDKAAKKNVHLLSVLWVDSCRKNNERVPEKMFPAMMPEAVSSPVLPSIRLKKMKSMQPSDFDTDVVLSAERCDKRRKKIATMNRFQISESTPEATTPNILVHETQPRSCHSPLDLARDPKWTTPVSLTVPDTPASMREKLRELKLSKLNGTGPEILFEKYTRTVHPICRWQMHRILQGFGDDKLIGYLIFNITGTDFSPLARPNDEDEQLIRRLFVCKEQEEDEDPLPPITTAESAIRETFGKKTTKLKGNNKKKLLTEQVKPMSFLMEPSRCSSDERPSLVSPAQRPKLKGKKAKETSDLSNSKKSRGKRLSEPVTPMTRKVTEEPTSGPGLMCRRDPLGDPPGSGPSNRGRKRKTAENSESDVEKQASKKTKCDSENETPKTKSVIQRRRSVRLVSTASGVVTASEKENSSDTRSTTLCESEKSDLLGSSMSMMFDSTALSGLPRPRHSIDEFSVGKPRQKKSSRNNTSKLSHISENDGSAKPRPRLASKKLVPSSSGGSGDDEATETSMDGSMTCSRAPKPNSIKLRRANSFTMETSTSQANVSLTSRLRPSIVMTSLHTHEQETIISIIKKVGGFMMHDDVCETTTHVVYGEPRRTLNVLAAIARGCWLLKAEWVFKSVEAGHWLDEEEYECNEKFIQAKIVRQRRQTEGDDFKQTLFSDCGPIFLSSKCVPPRGSLANLINLCGGQVTSSVSRCNLHVGPEPYVGKTSIKPVWILDCIMEQKVFPLDQYLMITTKKGDSSPEF